ncbi:MAG: ATP synthase F1 subunit gamma [Atopobiaceae bacterium]|nr:ATP synthase F1 subunit gamma [Olsenella sp.]MBQ3339255.1 ATP synthase F1 subunit gamma [Atopobiaceae bacterium]MBQ6491729.1 ATP synthase F1 subunit gamma [Atopobiaceae bacterium]
MAGNRQAIQSRIRSVKSTKKITKAMQMISNSKLAKQRKLMEANRAYAEDLQRIVGEIMRSGQQLESGFLGERRSEAAYTVFFCSDMGLCGGYNANVTKYAVENLRREDPILVVGTHACSQLRREGFALVNDEPISIDSINESALNEYLDEAMDLYLADKVGKVQVCYTRFVNTLTFEPAINVLLPYDDAIAPTEDGAAGFRELLFDPSPDDVLDQLIVHMVHNVAYSNSLETRTAEQGSRRLAMDTATNNAEELEDKLVLQFNQARQAAITQELTEIVGTANAL